jgi:P27 family predicted phage terminase small subunit
MPAGRPPTPIEKQQVTAKGDGRRPGGRPVSGTVVPVNRRGVAIPPAPTDLGKRGELEWYRIWEAGIVWLHPGEDYHWVDQIARAYDDIEQFRAEIERTGLIVKGYTKDMLVANPLIKEVRMLEATIRKCLSNLGFSPADRARLGLVEVKRQTGLVNLQRATREKRETK